MALLLGTVFWGCGFTWAKAAGESVQAAAGLPPRSAFGPIFLLAWRFLIATVIWVLVFPGSLCGWTWRGGLLALPVGIFCAGGLIVQHLGLDQTSEAVSAFLTSLTILFVPLLMFLVAAKPPRPVLWMGIAVAMVGVWLMTGGQGRQFGRGEVLGLACALLFSLYILAVNAAVERESPWRITGAQFAIVAMICFATCAFLPGGRANLLLVRMGHILSVRMVWLNLILLTVFTTLVAFGLLTFFQPRIDPTRAALIYLAEPVFATVYAAGVAKHGIGPRGLIGAALILVANVLVEVLSARTRDVPEERVVLVD